MVEVMFLLALFCSFSMEFVERYAAISRAVWFLLFGRLGSAPASSSFLKIMGCLAFRQVIRGGS